MEEMMTRFGDELRQEREARGVDVNAICASTKVSAQNLRALEAGDYGQMPGGVFRKGIVRSYLAALGLDEVLWMERFEVSVREAGMLDEGERDWVQFAENVKKGRSAEPVGMGWRWVGVALLVVMLWAVAWVAWHFVWQRKMPAREVAVGVPLDAEYRRSGALDDPRVMCFAVPRRG